MGKNNLTYANNSDQINMSSLPVPLYCNNKHKFKYTAVKQYDLNMKDFYAILLENITRNFFH